MCADSDALRSGPAVPTRPALALATRGTRWPGRTACCRRSCRTQSLIGALTSATGATRLRRRVRRLDDPVLLPDERLALAGRCAPQHEDGGLGPLPQCTHHLLGEVPPSRPPVGVSVTGTHGQGGVEEQHSLARPVLQVAVVRPRHAEVALQLLVDVGQGVRDRDPGSDGRGETVRGYGPWPRMTTFTRS